MNERIANIFDKLQRIYDILGEPYTAMAYRTGAAAVRNLDYTIGPNRMPDTGVNKVRGIGTGLAAKIREIVDTDRCAELDKLEAEPEVKAFDIFSGTIGFGPMTIRKLIAAKIYNHDDLRKAVSREKIKLTSAQGLGLKYYTDLQTRIPRAEVTTLGGKFISLIKSLSPSANVEIVGSYRRGLPTSGDIDIICTAAGAKIRSEFQRELEADPKYIGTISQGPQRITFLYYGALCRQVDILWVPKSAHAAAILYFTGSANFNQQMRGHALRNGFRLNQMGLFKVTKSGLKEVPAKTEEDIFTALGLPFVPPASRV